jgi:hypothetical protein
MSDWLTVKAALHAAKRARAIAASGEFDEDATRLLLDRAERELEEVSSICEERPKKPKACGAVAD